MRETIESFWDAAQPAIQAVSAFVPKLLLSIIILLVGWLIAKILRRVTVKLLNLARVGDAAEKSGIEGFLNKGGVPFTTVTLLSQLVYWFILLLTFVLALNSFGIQINSILIPVFKFIPNVFFAVIILIFGSLIAKIIETAIRTYLTNVGISTANVVSTTSFYAIWIGVIYMALNQLGVVTDIVAWSFQILLAGFALAFGIAFGLGGKDVAKEICERVYKSFVS